MKRSYWITAVLALLWVGTASANPLDSILGSPQVSVDKTDFKLRARIVNGGTSTQAGWSARLYFNTDLNTMTGWFPTRGYEYVATPVIGRTPLPVAPTVLESSDGCGGTVCGWGTWNRDSHAIKLTVPLAAMGPSDGSLTWELMVFDESGVWIGSYLGRVR